MDLGITGIEIGAFLFSAMAFFKMQRQQIQILEYLSFFEKSVVFNPELLKKVLTHSAPRIYTNSIKDFEEGENLIKGLVMLQGKISSDSEILSTLNKKSKLVLRSLSKHSVYSNLHILPFNSKKYLVSFLRKFNLIDSWNKKEKVEIFMNRNTYSKPAMNLIQMNMNRRKMNLVEKIGSWGFFILKILMTISPFLSKRIKGYKLGEKSIESGIRVGDYIVAFGEMIFDRKEGTITLQNPSVLMKNKDQMVKKLRARAIRNTRNTNLLFCLTATLGFMTFRRLKKMLSKLLLKIKMIKEIKRMEKLINVSKIMVDDFKCIICCEIAKNVIFKPCLHMAVCSLCNQKLNRRVCVICKRKIDDVVTVYVV